MNVIENAIEKFMDGIWASEKIQHAVKLVRSKTLNLGSEALAQAREFQAVK